MSWFGLRVWGFCVLYLRLISSALKLKENVCSICKPRDQRTPTREASQRAAARPKPQTSTHFFHSTCQQVLTTLSEPFVVTSQLAGLPRFAHLGWLLLSWLRFRAPQLDMSSKNPCEDSSELSELWHIGILHGLQRSVKERLPPSMFKKAFIQGGLSSGQTPSKTPLCQAPGDGASAGW